MKTITRLFGCLLALSPFLAPAAAAPPSLATAQPRPLTVLTLNLFHDREDWPRRRVQILETLQHTLGNRTHAATILGISIRTLRNKLRQYGDQGVPIPPPAGGFGEPAAEGA